MSIDLLSRRDLLGQFATGLSGLALATLLSRDASAAPIPPAAADPRQIEVAVASDVSDENGQVLVTVTSHADERIDEIVLRWSSGLDQQLRLRPFVPSPDRIRDGGPPLVQEWTKWVVGPGERGEPAGTTSLGWGPLLPGATLAIALDATRLMPGPVAFDLQLLAGEGLLTLADGGSAELRVEVP